MHNHDLDLIAEYASGLLTGADESRAAELVRTCDSCAEEFADHQAIRSLLATAPAPALSEFERTKLRRSVLDAVAPPASATSPWLTRLRPLMGAAAAMLVLVVGVGVVANLGSTDDGLTLADGGESATTAAADALVPMDEEGLSGDDTMSALSDSDEQDQADADVAEDSVAESAARSALMIDAGDVIDASALDSVLGELTAVVQETRETLTLDDAVAFGATCAPSVEDEILGLVLAQIDGVASQVFLVGDPAEPGVEILLTADCSVVAP